MITKVTNDNFKEIINSNDVVLVDFFADWCGPCKALHPILDSVSNKFEGSAIVAKINVDENRALAEEFSVRSIPALFYFKNGKVVHKEIGLQSEGSLSTNLKNLIKNN